MCEQALKYNLVDPAYLQPDVMRTDPNSGRQLAYYGIVTAALTTKVPCCFLVRTCTHESNNTSAQHSGLSVVCSNNPQLQPPWRSRYKGK